MTDWGGRRPLRRIEFLHQIKEGAPDMGKHDGTNWKSGVKGFGKCRLCKELFPYPAKGGRPPQYCPKHRKDMKSVDAENKRRHYIAQRYGVSLEEYDARMEGAVCAICGATDDLVYDHDHTTGAFRGVLCRPHNFALGNLGDNIEGMWKAFRYIAGVPTRPDVNVYGMMIATSAAARSDCRRAKVGAAIFGPEGTLRGTGYVGTDPGKPGCLSGACPRGLLSLNKQLRGGDYSNCISRHAEHNAILFSRGELTGCTIYITREPCSACHDLIQNSGIFQAYWPNGFRVYLPTSIN